MKKRNIIILAICLIILIVSVVYIFKSRKNEIYDDKIYNINEISNNENFTIENGGLKISDIKISKDDNNITTISIIVTNISQKNIEKEKKFQIILLDNNGKEIYTINTSVDSLKINDSKNLVFSVLDLGDIYSFKLIVDKKE